MKLLIIAAFLLPALSRATALEDYNLNQKTWGRTTFKTTSEVRYSLRLKDGESFYGSPCEKLNDEDFETDFREAKDDAKTKCQGTPGQMLSAFMTCLDQKALAALNVDPICKTSQAPRYWVSAFLKVSQNKKCIMELFLQASKKNGFPDQPNIGTGAEFSVAGDVRAEDNRNVIPMTLKRTEDGKSKLLGKANLVCCPDTDIEDINASMNDFGISEGLKLDLKPAKKSGEVHAVSRGTASEIPLETEWPPKKKK